MNPILNNPYREPERHYATNLAGELDYQSVVKGRRLFPYTDKEGVERDKTEKTWAVRNRWLPAVNAIRATHDWPRWDFLEINADIRDTRNDILKKLATL